MSLEYHHQTVLSLSKRNISIKLKLSGVCVCVCYPHMPSPAASQSDSTFRCHPLTLPPSCTATLTQEAVRAVISDPVRISLWQPIGTSFSCHHGDHGSFQGSGRAASTLWMERWLVGRVKNIRRGKRWVNRTLSLFDLTCSQIPSATSVTVIVFTLDFEGTAGFKVFVIRLYHQFLWTVRSFPANHRKPGMHPLTGNECKLTLVKHKRFTRQQTNGQPLRA